jgi:hypothetical protein
MNCTNSNSKHIWFQYCWDYWKEKIQNIKLPGLSSLSNLLCQLIQEKYPLKTFWNTTKGEEERIWFVAFDRSQISSRINLGANKIGFLNIIICFLTCTHSKFISFILSRLRKSNEIKWKTKIIFVSLFLNFHLNKLASLTLIIIILTTTSHLILLNNKMIMNLWKSSNYLNFGISFEFWE